VGAGLVAKQIYARLHTTPGRSIDSLHSPHGYGVMFRHRDSQDSAAYLLKSRIMTMFYIDSFIMRHTR